MMKNKNISKKCLDCKNVIIIDNINNINCSIHENDCKYEQNEEKQLIL